MPRLRKSIVMVTANNRAKKGRSRQNREIQIDTTEYTTRLELLYEVAQKATSYSEVLKLIENILYVTRRVLQASAVSLFLFDNSKGVLYYLHADGKEADGLSQMKLDVDLGIVGWVARNGQPSMVDDVSEDKRFNKAIDGVHGVAAKSILAVPIARGQKVIGVLEVINKADGSAFNEQDLSVLAGLASTEALILLVSMAVITLHNIALHEVEPNWQETTIETLVTVADIEGSDAGGHSRRVRDYAMLAAQSLSFSPEELRIIEFGALLHDIGKIGIADHILLSSGSLSDEEWSIIRQHPLIGANIVGAIPFLVETRDIVLNHHEWYDGTGYPQGLKGEDIPIGARILAVAEAFDTMTTDHFYQAALSVDEAMNKLTSYAGTQFCPVVVEAFISALKKQEEELARKDAERAAREKPKREVAEDRKVKDTESADAWMDKGITLVGEGRDREALDAFLKAIELNPESAIAWRNKGTALGRLGRVVEALAALVKAIELEPGSVSAWHDRATVLSKLGRSEEAEEAREVEESLKKKAELVARVPGQVGDTESADAWMEKGTTLVREGRDSEALDAFLKFIELNPESAIAWRNKGTALGRLGRDEEALAALVKAIELEPESVSAWHNKATALSKLGRSEEAEEAREVEESLKKKAELVARVPGQDRDVESANAWRAKGTTLVGEGRDREALDAFLKAIELDPKYKIRWTNKIGGLLGFGGDKEVRKAREVAYLEKKRAEYLKKKRAKQEAREEAKRQAEEARKAKEAEELEKKGAREQEAREKEAREKAKRQAEEARKAKEAEELEKKGAREQEAREKEAREKAKRQAEEAKKAKEAEELEKKGAREQEAREQEAREKAKRQAEEAKKAKEAERQEKKRARQEAREKEAREKAKRQAKEARKAEADVSSIDLELFEGDIRLEVKSSVGFEKVEEFKKSLRMVENLKVTLDSWSKDEGFLIFVSLQAPMRLGSILSQIPIVERVYKNRQSIVVVLKA